MCTIIRKDYTMNRFDYLLIVIEYIENNLGNKINTDHLAKLSYVSCMQLYRDFYAYTGHSVKEYVRKRRLSEALSLIKTTNKAPVDIAYEYGYSSQQALCKCVKKAISQTPLQYKDSDDYFYYPRFTGDIDTYVYVASKKLPRTISVKYYHKQMRGIENRAIHHLLSLFPNIDTTIYGKNGTQIGDNYCYELLVKYNKSYLPVLHNSLFDDVRINPEHTQTYATLQTTYDEAKINNAWDYLYTDWLSHSMFEQDDSDFFEEYIIKHNTPINLRLHLPIRKEPKSCGININNHDDRYYMVCEATGVDAEKESARTLLDYINTYYPTQLNTAKEYIVIKNSRGYISGIRLTEPINLDDSIVNLMILKKGSYAELNAKCTADDGVHKHRLSQWLSDNDMIRDISPIFSIYKSNHNSDNDISMKICCRIDDMLKKYNTN